MVINNSESVGYPTLETTACDSRGILKLNQNLIINKGVLHELYRVDKGAPFATGLYAQVRRCKSLRPSSPQKSTASTSSSSSQTTQPYYAAKFSPRKRPGHSQNEDCVESLHEIALLCQLKNPYIISFKDAFILDDFIVTIMEFAPGGDLQSVIDADLVLLESDASRYVYQLLDALKYLHSRHIAHLDIKPQNLLLMGEFPTCDIKLCDFEISRVIRPGTEVREILGTPDYVAPEILMYEPLSTFCDMWSVGILTYVLLTGFSPFGGDTDQETFRNIINEPIDFPDELFEDVSPAAIDFIEKLAVKNGRTRPSAQDMEMHRWVRSYAPPSAIIVSSADEPLQSQQPISKERESSIPPESPFLSHCGPKKRSPRKASAISGCSTASASPAGRRQSARSILRACKSAYDLNKMGGKTKSREALIEKMRIATGEPSGGPWKLRKNLSKSREQLWESKIQLSKSCEKINNFPGSSRWASVANFPSLDMNTMKSAVSQESVISVMSTCTNIGNAQQQLDMSDWQQQGLDDTFPYSVSMPSTPPVPNFDLSHNNGFHEGSPPIITNNFTGLQGKINQAGEYSGYPSLNNINGSNGDIPYMTREQAANAAIEESQKSVAELIMTFGGRVSKKLDLKNKFEPILEVDGSEEQPMSLGDCSDNNSTSGVSSIVATNGKNDNGNVSTRLGTDTSHNGKNNVLSPTNKMDTGQHLEPGSGNNSRRNSKTTQQISDEMKSSERRHNTSRGGDNYHHHTPTTYSTRRGSMSPPKHPDGTTLKGILKKPKQQTQTDSNVHHPRTQSEFPNNPSSTRRGSIPSNCFRLYEQHTISSSAKAPKRSILKNSNHQSQENTNRTKTSHQVNNNKGGSSDRSTSRSPENNNNNNKELSNNNEGKNENITSSTTHSNTSGVQLRGNRPTSVLLASNADNKLDRLGSPSSRRRPRPRSADISGIVIPTEKDKAFEKEMRLERNNRHQSKKRNEQNQLNQSQNNNNNLVINNNHNSSGGTSQPQSLTDQNVGFPSNTDGSEPAAVAIKVFPPDPIIIPKSSVLLLNSGGKNPESPTGSEDISPASDFKDYAKRNSTSSTSSASSTSTTTLMSTTCTNKQMVKVQQDGIKSQWGVVCTGSVERAKERFESVRSKLRRGSVPDF